MGQGYLSDVAFEMSIGAMAWIDLVNCIPNTREVAPARRLSMRRTKVRPRSDPSGLEQRRDWGPPWLDPFTPKAACPRTHRASVAECRRVREGGGWGTDRGASSLVRSRSALARPSSRSDVGAPSAAARSYTARGPLPSGAQSASAMAVMMAMARNCQPEGRDAS